MLRILLTGASGFIGSALLERLGDLPLDILVVSRREPRIPARTVARIAWRKVDLLQAGSEPELVHDRDTILHLAGSTARSRTDAEIAYDRAINLDATSRLVAAAAAGGLCPTFLFTGSESQHDRHAPLPLVDATPDAAETAYDRHKNAAEALLFAADIGGAVRGVSLRLPTVYGTGPSVAPGRGVVAAMVGHASAGRPIEIYGDGSLLRDFLHVNDAVAGIVAAVAQIDRLRGRHWLLSSGASHDIAALAEAIRAAASERGIAAPPATTAAPPIALDDADRRNVRIDDTPFRTATAWAAVTPLRAGIRSMLDASGAEPTCRVAA